MSETPTLTATTELLAGTLVATVLDMETLLNRRAISSFVLAAVCATATASNASAQNKPTTTSAADEGTRVRLAAGMAGGLATEGIAAGVYVEGGSQLTDIHAISARFSYGMTGQFCLFSPCSSITSFAIAAMYSYTPTQWFELQAGIGIDSTTERFNLSNGSADRHEVLPALDARVAFAFGGGGPGSRGSVDLGLHGHLVPSGNTTVALTLGFKLY